MSNITKISKKLRLRGVEFNKEEFIGLFIGHVKENIESMKLNIKRYEGYVNRGKMTHERAARYISRYKNSIRAFLITVKKVLNGEDVVFIIKDDFKTQGDCSYTCLRALYGNGSFFEFHGKIHVTDETLTEATCMGIDNCNSLL